MFCDLLQHVTPAATLRHEGSGLAVVKSGLHPYCGMNPKAMMLVITTPMGWKSDKRTSRNLLFCGMNSKQIVVSIGILPPSPKPQKAVRMRNVVYVFVTPRNSPNTEVMKTVRLNAHFRPDYLLA